MSERRVVLFLVLAFVVVGATSVATAWYSLTRIDREFTGVNDFHTQALFEILAINQGISEAIQESMAYALSGNVEEKVDYLAQQKQLARRIDAFVTVARLDQSGEAVELAEFRKMKAGFVELGARGGEFIAEFDHAGAVSHETFEAYEHSIDLIGPALDHLIQLEEAKVEVAQAKALTVIAGSKKLVFLQGIATLAAALLAAFLVTRMLHRLFAGARGGRTQGQGRWPGCRQRRRRYRLRRCVRPTTAA